jgi:hypothetical protein
LKRVPFAGRNFAGLRDPVRKTKAPFRRNLLLIADRDPSCFIDAALSMGD